MFEVGIDNRNLFWYSYKGNVFSFCGFLGIIVIVGCLCSVMMWFARIILYNILVVGIILIIGFFWGNLVFFKRIIFSLKLSLKEKVCEINVSVLIKLKYKWLL